MDKRKNDLPLRPGPRRRMKWMAIIMIVSLVIFIMIVFITPLLQLDSNNEIPVMRIMITVYSFLGLIAIWGVMCLFMLFELVISGIESLIKPGEKRKPEHLEEN